ncbi:Hypotetical protein [Gulosibacter molinativorax]|nr:Hypotetical protein [Gulosibacter molinativorax]
MLRAAAKYFASESMLGILAFHVKPIRLDVHCGTFPEILWLCKVMLSIRR